MKKIQLLLLLVFASSILSAQTLEELQAMKAEKKATMSEFQSKADAVQGEIDGLDAQIEELTGWVTGLNGLLGFDFTKSNGWIANPSPESESSSLNIGITTFANKDKAKYFWNNKGIIQKAWQDVDTPGESDADGNPVDDGLFDDKNGSVDIVNVSSLAGYKIHPKLALSGLGELNTSLGNFLKPGTADIGVGATWLPIKGMTVVIHPLNYHLAWNEAGDLLKDGALGVKIRADYGRNLTVLGKKIGWNSTFTTYQPYSTKDGAISLSEYTWLNSVNFTVWKGIGVGIGFGLRQADFETFSETVGEGEIQSYYNVGLNYGF